MAKQVFVPITDELLYEHPELIAGPIIPYKTSRPCHRWSKPGVEVKRDSSIAGSAQRATRSVASPMLPSYATA